ncbi:hypothetical protein HOLleu_40645 [Holothuria leucospilota]|uniref:Uncharacterized protein n=1 Tax=Holothuria leucospilota TaxID=206669 RepID=A0A9Q0YHY5_HOLLE|nr:hypothetical protein HOLleu_40645 [Holothuria leucospilota]
MNILSFFCHRDLHWLTVKHHVWYKITFHTFMAIHGFAPVCLNDLIKRHIKPGRVLRSVSDVLLCPPKITKTNYYGDCVLLQHLLMYGTACPLDYMQ